MILVSIFTFVYMKNMMSESNYFQSPTHNVESFSNDRLTSVGGLGEIGIVIVDSPFKFVYFRSSKKVPSSFNTEVCDPTIDLI